MAESSQKKLKRVRPPRVHLTYDVEVGDAVVQQELPFVVGVMGDFSGNPSKQLDPLKKRRFIEIDRDNFNEVMAKMGPELNLRVENTMQDDGSEMAVQLKFQSLDDFQPAQVASQVPALKKLVETRNKLRELLSKVDRSPELENVLEDVLMSTDKLARLTEELGATNSSSPDTD